MRRLRLGEVKQLALDLLVLGSQPKTWPLTPVHTLCSSHQSAGKLRGGGPYQSAVGSRIHWPQEGGENVSRRHRGEATLGVAHTFDWNGGRGAKKLGKSMAWVERFLSKAKRSMVLKRTPASLGRPVGGL